MKVGDEFKFKGQTYIAKAGKPGDNCKGCAFKGEPYTVCMELPVCMPFEDPYGQYNDQEFLFFKLKESECVK